MKLSLAIALLATTAASPAVAQAPAPTPEPVNPCLGSRAYLYACPDLVMQPPFGIRLDRKTNRGRVLLRAGNSIDNLGEGPAELHGVRAGRIHMDATQRIHRWRGGTLRVRTGARLVFKRIPDQPSYWKFQNAARFELWRLDAAGARVKLVRTGPKVSYCLRDLAHSHPELLYSPPARVYPACGTDRDARTRTLGTSVGFSDVYPPKYHEQWIDVTRLSGCFAYVHIADPLNHIHESNEDNNRSQVVVRLPYRRGAQRCPGESGVQPPPPPPAPYRG